MFLVPIAAPAEAPAGTPPQGYPTGPLARSPREAAARREQEKDQKYLALQEEMVKIAERMVKDKEQRGAKLKEVDEQGYTVFGETIKLFLHP